MRKIKSVEDLRNTKIYIENKEDVIKFQETVLNIGVKWADLCNGIRPNFNTFYISRALKMRVSSIVNEKTMLFFINHKNTQIFLGDVMKLKPKIRFKAKEDVLVRQSDGGEWWLTEFSHYTKQSRHPHACTNGFSYKFCIPYEENRHLLGTTKDK